MIDINKKYITRDGRDVRPKSNAKIKDSVQSTCLRLFLMDEIVYLENKNKYKKAQFLRSIIDKYDTQNRK